MIGNSVETMSRMYVIKHFRCQLDISKRVRARVNLGVNLWNNVDIAIGKPRSV